LLFFGPARAVLPRRPDVRPGCRSFGRAWTQPDSPGPVAPRWDRLPACLIFHSQGVFRGARPFRALLSAPSRKTPCAPEHFNPEPKARSLKPAAFGGYVKDPPAALPPSPSALPFPISPVPPAAVRGRASRPRRIIYYILLARQPPPDDFSGPNPGVQFWFFRVFQLFRR